MDSYDEADANKIMYPFIHAYAVLVGIYMSVFGQGASTLLNFFLGTLIGWLLTWITTMIIAVVLGVENKSGSEVRQTATLACFLAAIIVPVLISIS